MNPRDTELPPPPVAIRVPKTTTIHGDTLVDDYFWMRERENPEVRRYLEDENRYTDAVMRPTEAFQEALYKEMLARIKETDLSVPARRGAHLYYFRTEQGLQYPIHCRKPGSLDAPEEIVLDENELAKGHAFFSLGTHAPSESGTLLLYTTDTVGYRQYKLFVKNLATGEVLGPVAERVTSACWANDNRTLVYTTEDETTKRSNKLFRHRLGEPAGELVYEEVDELYRLFAAKTRSRAYILAFSASQTTSEIRYLFADRPEDPPTLMLPRREGHEYHPDHRGNLFYIRTNDKGRNFRLVAAPVSDPSEANWREVLPHSDEVMIEDVECFAGHIVVSELKEGLSHFRVLDLATAGQHHVAFPEPAYTLFPAANFEFDTTKFRFIYTSFVTPRSVFEYDLVTRERALLKETEVLGGYDRSCYRSERVFATAKDGARIPISLLYRKDLTRDGSAPMLLTAYGSYGHGMSAFFNSNRFTLVDRGFVFALAHIRGGNEMGKIWHETGRLMHKMNTFTDFIAAAEHLIAEGYTRKEKLVITGGSAGGLLMGAVVNMRPDLFHAAVSHVPFVDVMNTMLDASLPLTVGEYLEWGNPNEKDAYFYMKAYSPYDNVEAKAYPRMLVRTSWSDSQVMYWEAAKYVAKLRARKTDANVLLLKTNMEAGHGGASGRYDALRETAFDYAFILSQLGIAS
jgi:oligopeptidase B